VEAGRRERERKEVPDSLEGNVRNGQWTGTSGLGENPEGRTFGRVMTASTRGGSVAFTVSDSIATLPAFVS